MRTDFGAEGLELRSGGQVADSPRFEAFQQAGELRRNGIERIPAGPPKPLSVFLSRFLPPRCATYRA
jgi:hypothetical protein